MNSSIKKFLQKFPDAEQNKPLAPFTTFGIGGPADLFYNLKNPDDLQPLVKTAIDLNIPFFILGGGSNTIFADEGFHGLIIHMATKNIALDDDLIIADAGALLSQVIQFSLKNGLTGMEKLMGLPGTIGGAVRGNAGAFGIEIKDIFQKALLFSPKNGLHEADSQYMDFSYRTSTIKKTPELRRRAIPKRGGAKPGQMAQNAEIILKAWLKLHPATPEQAKSALSEATDIVKNRISKQPKGKCSGSFFKNPKTPDYRSPQPQETKAGYLLEQIGAKGLKVGGVRVSPQHANWLMNEENGTQKNVMELSGILQNKVKERFNILLEREVQLVSPTGMLLS